jgi:glycosyltransferase involved in cell wall biosynthesis
MAELRLYFTECASLIKNTHVVISLMDQSQYGSMLSDLGIEVFTLDFPNGKIKFSGLLKLYKLIKAINPDAIQTWMYNADLIGGVMGRLAGVRNITWGVHHTTLVKDESKRSTILIAKLNSFLFKFIPQNIIYCAEKSREVKDTIGFSQSKGLVVPNDYNIIHFQLFDKGRTSLRKELGVDDDVFLIGHVGRFDPQKDHKNLVEAIAGLDQKVNSFKVVFVGSNLDSENKVLTKKISEHNLDNQFILFGRRSDIPKVINGFDLFLLSSTCEAFPNVLNEAMAWGTTCVTTDVGDAAVIVGDTGWIVEPRNPQQLATAIEKSIDEFQSDKQAWLTRKKEARNRIFEKFSIEKVVPSYKHVRRQ